MPRHSLIYFPCFRRSVDPSVAEKNREMAEWGFRFLDMILSSFAAAASSNIPSIPK